MARTFLRHIRVSSKEEPAERILKGVAEMNEQPFVFLVAHHAPARQSTGRSVMGSRNTVGIC